MTTQFTAGAAAAWVAVSAPDAERGKWQVIRVLDGGAVETLGNVAPDACLGPEIG